MSVCCPSCRQPKRQRTNVCCQIFRCRRRPRFDDSPPSLHRPECVRMDLSIYKKSFTYNNIYRKLSELFFSNLRLQIETNSYNKWMTQKKMFQHIDTQILHLLLQCSFVLIVFLKCVYIKYSLNKFRQIERGIREIQSLCQPEKKNPWQLCWYFVITFKCLNSTFSSSTL